MTKKTKSNKPVVIPDDAIMSPFNDEVREVMKLKHESAQVLSAKLQDIKKRTTAIEKSYEAKNQIISKVMEEELNKIKEEWEKLDWDIKEMENSIDTMIMKDLRASDGKVDKYNIPVNIDFENKITEREYAKLEKDIRENIEDWIAEGKVQFNDNETLEAITQRVIDCIPMYFDSVAEHFGKMFKARIDNMQKMMYNAINRKSTKPVGSTIQERNEDIRKRAYDMEQEGKKASYIYEEIAKEYPKLKPSTIKTIVTKQNY